MAHCAATYMLICWTGLSAYTVLVHPGLVKTGIEGRGGGDYPDRGTLHTAPTLLFSPFNMGGVSRLSVYPLPPMQSILSLSPFSFHFHFLLSLPHLSCFDAFDSTNCCNILETPQFSKNVDSICMFWKNPMLNKNITCGLL